MEPRTDGDRVVVQYVLVGVLSNAVLDFSNLRRSYVVSECANGGSACHSNFNRPCPPKLVMVTESGTRDWIQDFRRL